MFEIRGKYTTATVMIDDVEEECRKQIIKMVNHPAFTNPISIMPDTHSGKGSVIGFTMELSNKVVPNVVGVDIGCNMLCFPLYVGEVDSERVDDEIRRVIPFGREIHKTPIFDMKNKFNWKGINNVYQFSRPKLEERLGIPAANMEYSYDWFAAKCKQIGIDQGYAECSVGTLGGGNHFIEFGKNTVEQIFCTVHSGSRNFGLKVCNYWQKVANKNLNNKRVVELRKNIDEIKSTCTKHEIEGKIMQMKIDLGIGTSNDLAYLEGDDLIGYLQDMLFAQ